MFTLFCIIPCLIYIYIIWLSTPFNSVSLRGGVKYINGGFLSAFLVLISSILIPIVNKQFFLDYSNPIISMDEIQFAPTLLTEFISAFFQTALIEELSKFAIFYIILHFLTKDKNEINPISIMFYTMLIGAGFSMNENVLYLIRYDITAGDTILVRSFSAVLLHMVVGLSMGYFIALSKMNISENNHSEFSIWMNINAKYRKIIYIIFGILSATIIHGLYDFDLAIQWGYNMPIIIIGLVYAYFIFRDLKKKYLKELESAKQEN